MAIFEKPFKDGIQLGNKLDVCMTCSKLNNYRGNVGELEYKEVFKLHLNGIEYVLCMDHFQDILGDYVLVHKDTLKDEDVIEVDMEKIENMDAKEADEYIEEQAKASTKKAKKK